jgi:hypothetical protein
MNHSVFSNIKCQTCGAVIEPGHEAHRGLLGNLIANLSGGLVTSREMLESLERKHFAHPDKAKQRAETVLLLKKNIERNEVLLAELRRVQKDCYSHG